MGSHTADFVLMGSAQGGVNAELRAQVPSSLVLSVLHLTPFYLISS